VAIANDPINSGRGLQLLAKAGLITLKPGVGYKATEEDIIANPKNIKILQVEAVQLVRAYDDADIVQGYPAYIRLAKTFDAGSALLFDGLDHKEYVIQFVIQPKSKTDPRLIKFVDIYQHSPAVRAALDKAHGKLYQAGWES
jgi:D-methionine transport system substrate-binding protein